MSHTGDTNFGGITRVLMHYAHPCQGKGGSLLLQRISIKATITTHYSQWWNISQNSMKLAFTDEPKAGKLNLDSDYITQNTVLGSFTKNPDCSTHHISQENRMSHKCHPYQMQIYISWRMIQFIVFSLQNKWHTIWTKTVMALITYCLWTMLFST